MPIPVGTECVCVFNVFSSSQLTAEIVIKYRVLVLYYYDNILLCLLVYDESRCLRDTSRVGFIPFHYWRIILHVRDSPKQATTARTNYVFFWIYLGACLHEKHMDAPKLGVYDDDPNFWSTHAVAIDPVCTRVIFEQYTLVKWVVN